MTNTAPVTFHTPIRLNFSKQDAIILCTLNARYIHASLGLRYLMANMGPLHESTRLIEFTINQRTNDIAEKLLAFEPMIIGFGVYIWNIKETTELVALLHKLNPAIKIVIGGPEVSYEYEHTAIFEHCDHLITGQADIAFANTCQQLIKESIDSTQASMLNKVIEAPNPDVNKLATPYPFYNDEDIKQRVLYVEASRGCPFKCEFCLSALDKTAWPFALDTFLQELNTLYLRGARQYKFVDRTFNLKISNCTAILEFFLKLIATDQNLFLHFEVIPDKLPDALKNLIEKFPPGSLQFEIGIQSFNTTVQETISRRQNIAKTLANIEWLRNHSHAYIHADLIFGLPGENLESFADGFDQLVSLNPHEIQLGLLKRLRGSPIVKQTAEFQMIYSDEAPYQLLKNRDISFDTMQRVQRFARYWDLIANSGRFTQTLPVLLGDAPFTRFMALSDWLFATTEQTHKIAYTRLLALLYTGAISIPLASADTLFQTLESDCASNSNNPPPRWLRLHQPPELRVSSANSTTVAKQPAHTATEYTREPPANTAMPARQNRHLRDDPTKSN